MLPLPFAYPVAPHVRRHGPQGYRDYQSFKPWLRDEFTFRCVYCLFRERWYPSGHGAFSVDHLLPQIQAPHRICDYSNLTYACLRCNSRKQDALVPDPCSAAYGIHLRVRDDGTIEGLTPDGEWLIDLLRLDDRLLTEWRRRLLDILRRIEATLPRPSLWQRALDWVRRRLGLATNLRPLPPDVRAELEAWMGFPDDVPNLARLRPPGDNSRPAALDDCFTSSPPVKAFSCCKGVADAKTAQRACGHDRTTPARAGTAAASG